jgi:hypothetical protein
MRSFPRSRVIDDLNLIGIPVAPRETNSELIVDPGTDAWGEPS